MRALGPLRLIVAALALATFASPPASACALGTAGANGPDRITKNLYDAAGQLLQVRRVIGYS